LRGVADKLRGNVDHSEFRGYVFALLFFKRISINAEGVKTPYEGRCFILLYSSTASSLYQSG